MSKNIYLFFKAKDCIFRTGHCCLKELVCIIGNVNIHTIIRFTFRRSKNKILYLGCFNVLNLMPFPQNNSNIFERVLNKVYMRFI